MTHTVDDPIIAHENQRTEERNGKQDKTKLSFVAVGTGGFMQMIEFESQEKQ